MKRGSRSLIAAVIFVIGFGSPARAGQSDTQRVDQELAGWMIGNMSLTGHDGQAFTQEQLKDRWTFLLFGETACKQACLSALGALTGMRKRIARTEVVKITQVLFVSLDARRDTPEGLRRYLAPFDPHIIGAIASRENVARMRDDLSASNGPPEAGSLWLIGPDLYVRGEFLPPYDVARLTEKFLKIRIGR
jgi:protein SCO1